MTKDSGYSGRSKPNLSLATQIKIVVANALSKYDQPDPTKVWGISTSFWSGHIDMAMAKDRGIQFAFIKFFDGKTLDPLAEANYKAAMDAKLLVSGYSWLYNFNVVSPGGAARAMLDFLKDHPCHIRPIVDFEWNKIATTPSDLYGFAVPFANGPRSITHRCVPLPPQNTPRASRRAASSGGCRPCGPSSSS